MVVYGRARKKRARSTKATSKRTYKKANYSLVAKVPRTALQTPFYGVKKVVHKYASVNNGIDPGLAAPGAYIFRANSLFDPDFTGTGAQPLGFDQMAAMYNRYTVTNAQIRVVFSNPSTNDFRIVVGVALARNATLQSRTQYMESHCSWDVLPSGSVSGDTKTVYLDVDIAKFFGVRNILDERDMSGTTTTNPLNVCYFHVWAADTGGGNPGGIQSTVEIAYTTMWKEPALLPSS